MLCGKRILTTIPYAYFIIYTEGKTEIMIVRVDLQNVKSPNIYTGYRLPTQTIS